MEQIKIDLVPNGVMSVAHASQFDVGRSMKFLLTDEGVTYTLAGTEVITMKLRKPDGTDDTISLANTSSSYVEWTTVDGDLDLSGVYLAEITITSGDDVLGTANFLLKVEPDPYNGKNLRIVTVGPADICTFETTLPEPYPSVTVNVVATGGNGTPENPNPIVGYSSANITRCGVNLFTYDLPIHDGRWSESAFVGSDNVVPLSSASGWSNIRVKIPEGGDITLSGFQAQGGVYGAFLGSDDPTDIVSTFLNWQTNKTFNVPNGAKYIGLCFFNLNTEYLNYPNAQLEIGSSVTTFNPYNGQTYTIAFGQTVYGGVLDVTRGKLHVTHKKETYNGSEAWSTIGTNVYYIAVPSEYQVSQTPKSNMYEGVAPTFYNTLANGKCALSTVLNNLLVHDDNITSLSDWQTALGNNNLEILYELATPFDIDLTPVQIRALVGENNVFADCGQTTVQYLDEE